MAIEEISCVESSNTAPQANKETTKSSQKKSKKKTKSKSAAAQIPRGMPKSGRPWKSPKQKFASIKKTIHRLPFEKKVELRNELRHIKEVSRGIKDKRKQDAIDKHQRRLENAERRLANQRRSEIVQIIKNPSKLRRMKRKQMRMIEKRDLSQVKVV